MKKEIEKNGIVETSTTSLMEVPTKKSLLSGVDIDERIKFREKIGNIMFFDVELTDEENCVYVETNDGKMVGFHPFEYIERNLSEDDYGMKICCGDLTATISFADKRPCKIDLGFSSFFSR